MTGDDMPTKDEGLIGPADLARLSTSLMHTETQKHGNASDLGPLECTFGFSEASAVVARRCTCYARFIGTNCPLLVNSVSILDVPQVSAGPGFVFYPPHCL